MWGKWLCIVAPVPLVYLACVGDPVTTDGGIADGAQPDTQVADTGTSDTGTKDAGADAGPACDPNKPFGQGVLVDINQPNTREDSFWMLPDELTAFFSSDRPRDGGPNGLGTGVYDLYSASRPDKQSVFGAATLLLPVSDMGVERLPVVTGDGLDLYFTLVGGNGAEVYHSHRNTKGDAFPTGSLLANVNSSADEWSTWVSNDGQTLWLQSTRPGSAGWDLYSSTLGGNGFSTPAAVVSVNSQQDDISAVLTPDQLTVYFSSNRTGTTGGYDIYVATRAKITDAFANIKNVTELNNTTYDAPMWVSADGCTLYYDISAGGLYHVYRASRPK